MEEVLKSNNDIFRLSQIKASISSLRVLKCKVNRACFQKRSVGDAARC